MTIASRRMMLQAQAGFRKDAETIFLGAADQARGIIMRYVGQVDKPVDKRYQGDIQREVGEVVQRLFVGMDGRSPFGRDGVTPLAPYPKALNQWLGFEMARLAATHRRYMLGVLPPDVQHWLRGARARHVDRAGGGVSGEKKAVREQIGGIARRIFEPNPLAIYEPAHRWVDPNGYTLSDRIWQNSVRTRMKVDALIAESIRNGRGALLMAKKLEQFLVPGRAAVRTNAPYGTDASADAMRLARTELARAFSSASRVSARANPFVTTMTWRTSGSHPKPDICDDLAAGSPYPIDDHVPIPVEDSHPSCLCTVAPDVTASPEDVVAELRAAMDDGTDAPMTPASNDWTYFLMGDLTALIA